MKKILFIVLDGLGDRPVKELGNKTPLAAAATPNFDSMAAAGMCGILEPYYSKALPTSEEGHFALFGYNSAKLEIGRGMFTARGSGISLKKGDIALRGNFSTVAEDMSIIDRRAGRIKETMPLIKDLSGMEIEGVKFLLKPAGEHRIGLVMRGRSLSSRISDGDPHYSSLGKKVKKILPLTKSKKAVFTAKVLNLFLERAHTILKEHNLNKKRKERGLPEANYILVRGVSSVKKIPSFREKYGLSACCVAGKILYKQIAETLGMKLIKVKGANGLVSTNIGGKIKAVLKALPKYDFVFLHIKATDSLAEDGNFIGKRDFIEKIDKEIKPLLKLKDTLVLVTCDHSTCCNIKSHCKAPIPLMVWGAGQDNVSEFSEKACSHGKLGKRKQMKLMKKVMSLASK